MGNIWNNDYYQYTPRIIVHARFDFPDTLKIPIVHGGTIKYFYDKYENKVSVYSVRNSSINERNKVEYTIDGFGNVKQKDIFTSENSFNSYKFKFNYLNKPARNFDANNDTTMFSYDGLARTIQTKNTDLSFTSNQYSYHASINDYFGNTRNGFVERQFFIDEENNYFVKYLDAVGNLLREVKYEDGTPNIENSPDMTTDYLYDSLYRLRKVKTPTGKPIEYAYDGYGRQSTRMTPDAGQTKYIYDKSSNLTYTQDANQKVLNGNKYTFRNYDAINRLTGTGENIFLPQDSPDDGNQFETGDPDYYLTINVYDTLSSAIVNIFGSPPSNFYPGPNYTRGQLVSTAFRTRAEDKWNYKYYRYDERGRVIKLWLVIDSINTKEISYEYNSQDQLTKTVYNDPGTDRKMYRYRYDFTGRLDSVDFYTAASGDDPAYYENFINYDYNNNSLVSQQSYKGTFLSNALNYNNRNWNVELYCGNGEIVYSNEYFKNGNIKNQWFYGLYRYYMPNTEELSFDYTYDKSNRLLSTDYIPTKDTTFDLLNSYDKDGNLLTLKRFGSSNNVKDNFNYVYFPNTNRLKEVTPTLNRFYYDANGNMTHDTLNKNFGIKYDHRNLIIELYQYDPGGRVIILGTRYFYDEAGNRIRKLTYKNTQSNPGPILNWSNLSNPGNRWTLYNNEYYVRGADGKEMATYQSNTHIEWYVWGNDMVGKIKGANPYYYFKDHLGSTRVIVNSAGTMIAGYDYDAWGYPLENRSFNSDTIKFKFTGKETGKENLYDYFGARYYDARIGRWGQVEPLLEKYYSFSPYAYSILNPLVFKDVNGKDAIAEIDEKNKRINIRITFNYSRYRESDPLGLSEKQYNTLLQFKHNIQDLWKGKFKLNGDKYELVTSVELLEYDSWLKAAIQTERNPGHNIVNNSLANDFIEGDVGVGSSQSVLFMRDGDLLNPRWDTGAHEVGHLLGLPDILDTESKSIMSYSIDRGPPGNDDINSVMNRSNLDFSIIGPQFIGGFQGD